MNCCQAVVRAFADTLDMPVDKLMQLSAASERAERPSRTARVAPTDAATDLKPGVAIVSCKDGLRPVIMKLEATDEESQIDDHPIKR